jgi:ATP-dependent DNA ligase
MFGRRPPVYVAFDILVADGQDLRSRPLSSRKAAFAKLARRARGWIAIVDGVPGRGSRLFDLVVAQDLEGVVAKRLDDPYGPDVTWWKILNRAYSQKEGRGELFGRRGHPTPRRSAVITHVTK